MSPVETQERLDLLEDKVRNLADDRALALVQQLRALDARHALEPDEFNRYMTQLESHIHSDLQSLSQEDRALIRELFSIAGSVLKGIRPSTFRRAIKRVVLGRIPASIDDFGRDQEFIDRIRPLTEFLFHKYWRIDVEGLENIPSTGPCLLVSNHSGILPFDAWMLQFAVEEYHPAGRPLRFLVEEWLTSLPFFSHNLTRMGQVRGSQQNAEQLLSRGELVGVFPEGVKGTGKPYSQRYHLQRFGRGGLVRLAMKTQAPIVPIAVVGAEETYPIMFTSGFIANALRAPYFPVTPFFPWLGPLGAIPLPSKWQIRVGEKVALGDFSAGSWEDDILVNTLNEDVRQKIQSMLTDLVQHRRSLFFG